MIALRSTDNLAFNWGYNIAGQLGTNDTLNRSSPVQIGSGPYKKVAGGYWGTSLLTFDGLLYRIGIGGNGELGDGLTAIYRSGPVQVASTTVPWADIFDPGFACVTARKEDGTLWMWGRQPVSGGGLSSPVLTSSAAGDNAVFTQGIGSISNGVVLMDSLGGLYAAGAGLNGYYKAPTAPTWISALAPQPFKLSSNYSPYQIGTRSYIQVSAGTDSSTAIDYSKTLYFWGTNYNYQSGLPTASQFTGITSPVAIGTAASSTSDGTTNTGYIKNA
jgi:alpha-tubulin suppressor-like RCC1 family protein